MSDHEYLVSHGWRLIAMGKGKYAQINYWDHPDHQPNRHGAFTQTGTVNHQKFLDKNNSCKCINSQGYKLR